MAASFLILHGLENHRPPQHWEFLLAADLVKAGRTVRYPALPDPDTPQLDDWLDALDRELGESGDDVTVVCHSLACLLWVHAAARGVRTAERVLLVAPPASEALPDTAASFRLAGPDKDAVLASARGGVLLVASDADPYLPDGVQRRYADALGLTATIVPDAGHFTPDDGFGPWPWVLDWCLGAREPNIDPGSSMS